MILYKYRHLRYYCLIRYYSVPVIINIVAAFFWYFLWKPGAAISAFSLIFNAFIGPIYLASCNADINNISIARKAGYSFLSISAGIIIHYCSWGFVTGRIFSPDSWTEAVLVGEFCLACTIISIGLIAQFVSKLKKQGL